MSMIRFCIHLVFAVVLLTSCSPAPTPTLSPPTSTPSQPTKANPATLDDGSMLKTGVGYSDASDDMAISFLDVIYFQASVDEEFETLKVVLHMRDIPATVPRGQVTNLVEYLWMIFVYLEPSKVTQADRPGDYYFALNTTIDDPIADTSRPIPGTPVAVPFHQLFENRSIYNSSGISVSSANVEINPDLDTLTFTGRMPGITSSAVFSFDMQYFDGTVDRPDNYVPPEAANLSTPFPEVTQAISSTLTASEDPARLIPAGRVRAYPGPEHYAGDILSFEITNDGSFADGTVIISMSLDNQEPKNVPATSSWTGLLLPRRLTQRNSADIIPFSLRPPMEVSMKSTPSMYCPRPSARQTKPMRPGTSRKPIAVSSITSQRPLPHGTLILSRSIFRKEPRSSPRLREARLTRRLNVYLADQIWGNGGFGGGGELLISYTDRYYGPTIGGEGLEVLARHEFTHAVDLDVAAKGDGINFNYEGLAVYVAGGHYKHEPLAERGAALYDLGYYVPVGEFISQHELAYLYPAAMLTYISETYGSEKIWKFLDADDDPDDGQLGPLDRAIQATFGIRLKEFDQGFQTWLEGHEPGEQLVDLRLTVELQDLRRQYQNTYAPAPNFLLAETPNAVARPEYLPIVMREAHTPANIAVELMIANAQHALLEGDYPQVEILDKTLAKILSTGRLDDPLAKDYLDIVLAAASEGYEVVNLDIQGNLAYARVTAQPPILSDLELQKINDTWQIQP